jgi:hypothetical protein
MQVTGQSARPQKDLGTLTASYLSTEVQLPHIVKRGISLATTGRFREYLCHHGTIFISPKLPLFSVRFWNTAKGEVSYLIMLQSSDGASIAKFCQE